MDYITDDDIRTTNKSKLWTAIALSIFELEKRSKAQNVWNWTGYQKFVSVSHTDQQILASTQSPIALSDTCCCVWQQIVWIDLICIYIYTYVRTCVRTYIRTYWSFNFDALALGNEYKPTKELINCRGPSEDRTHYLQTEATTPAAGLFSTFTSCHWNATIPINPWVRGV